MKKTELYRTAIDIIKAHHNACESNIEPLRIGTMEYSPADAWLSLDPIAYRESLLGTADVLLTEHEQYQSFSTEERRAVEDALADYSGSSDSIRFALLY